MSSSSGRRNLDQGRSAAWPGSSDGRRHFAFWTSGATCACRVSRKPNLSDTMAAQVAINALITAGGLCLVAMGFGLVFQTLRFFHFAHAGVITVGAYGFYWCCAFAGLPWFLSAIVGLFLAGLTGLGMEIGVYRGLRARNA